jgi:CDP-glucose 4,6-dehydratase
MNIDEKFWQNKRVFLTGHTGFKGGWLSAWLEKLGAQLTGFALNPTTQPCLYLELSKHLNQKSIIGDINDFELLNCSVTECDPEIVFHMAAQPLVRYSYNHPIETFQTNIIGTANLLEACRNLKNLKAVVVITTDKVYENRNWEWGYRETDSLGGHDPYSSSKACTEIITSAMRRSFFHTSKSAVVCTVRAGNVIGGGDWALDRIVPDVVKSFQESKVVSLRNPLAVRPWQHVLEPLSGYLQVAQLMCQDKGHDLPTSWNFGPNDSNAVPVEKLVSLLAAHWPGVQWKTDKGNHPHEAGFLKLDSSRAKYYLGWQPIWEIDRTAQMTMDWYRRFYSKEATAKELCLTQINEYHIPN